MERVPHEVWARAAWAAIDLVEMGGLDPTGLFDGLPFDAMTVRKLKRVTWEQYCILCENIDTLAGGGTGLEDLLESAYHAAFPEVRSMLGALVDSKTFLKFIMTVANPFLFPPVEHLFEDRGGRNVRCTVRLREGARTCEAWFRGSIGAYRGLPRHLGLGPAIVTAQIGPDHGIYDVVLPPDRTIAKRMRGAVSIAIKTVLGVEPDGTPVGITFGEHGNDPFETRVNAACVTWKLTPRQVDVLRLVARGESNKDIAKELGCAENTVELHVTQLLKKTGVGSRAQLIARFFHE